MPVHSPTRVVHFDTKKRHIVECLVHLNVTKITGWLKYPESNQKYVLFPPSHKSHAEAHTHTSSLTSECQTTTISIYDTMTTRTTQKARKKHRVTMVWAAFLHAFILKLKYMNTSSLDYAMYHSMLNVVCW